jgi:hypothetical protein
MALNKSFDGARGAITYWVIDDVFYRKASDETVISLAGWTDADVRKKIYPEADMRKELRLPGAQIGSIPTCYTLVKADPDWAGATDC